MSATNRSSRVPGKGVSVGTKLAVATVALMALVSIGVYFTLSRSLAQTLLTAKGEAAQQLGLLFAANVSAAVVFEDEVEIAESLKHLALNGDVTFAAIRSSSADDAGQDRGKELGRFLRSGAQQRSSLIEVSAPRIAWTPDTLSLSVPVLDQHAKIVAHALLEFSLANENTKIASARQRVLITSTGVAVAIALLLLIVSRRTVVVPLRRLQAGARQVERGDSAVFDIQSDDEVGDLARALTQMAGAIQEREAQIQRQNRDMRLVMDNVGQGFLTLNEHGAVADEYSQVVVGWFGRPEPQQNFVAYLQRVDPKFAAWFAFSFEQLVENMLPREVTLDQAPTRIVCDGKTWSVEYRPLLTADDRLERLIVVISDITHLLEKAAAERAQQEVIAALTCVTRDPQGFVGFLSEAEALLLAIESSTHETSSSLARHIHTLKGIAAMMELHSIVECCHDLEQKQLDSAGAPASEQTSELRRRWLEYRERIGPLLVSIGEGSFRVDRERYSTLLEALRTERPHQELLQELREWSYEDTKVPLERLAQHARQLAVRLNKGELTVEVEGCGVRIPRDACAGLWSALVHAVRNAVDHGLEAPSEREASGKQRRGSLRLETRWQDDHLVVSVSDDGRGISWPSIAERAKQLGLPSATESDLKKALCSARFTTRADATEISGRGIGTAALEEAVKQLGGRIEIETSPGRGTTFSFLIPRDSVLHGAFEAPSGERAGKFRAA